MEQLPKFNTENKDPRKTMLRIVFDTFFENWIQREKLFEAKPPLEEQVKQNAS